MINIALFILLGILIGFSIIYFLPVIQHYLPEIDIDQSMKELEQKHTNNYENTNKIIDNELINKLSSQNKKIMTEKQKQELKDIIESYRDDQHLQLKITLFKILIFLVFFSLVLIFLTGSLNPMIFLRKLHKEFDFYVDHYTKQFEFINEEL